VKQEMPGAVEIGGRGEEGGRKGGREGGREEMATTGSMRVIMKG